MKHYLVSQDYLGLASSHYKRRYCYRGSSARRYLVAGLDSSWRKSETTG